MTAAVSVDGLAVRYGDRWALRDVSLAVGPGEVLAVVGPSGSGKSTLLRALCGLVAPTTGRVVLDGADITDMAPERRAVAMVFQGFALFPHLTVADNVGFGLRVRRAPGEERRRRVGAAAESLGLTPLLDRMPGELSGGERQRVALARALVRDPVLFCLDEPLASLDPVLRVASRLELAAVLRTEGRCAVYVTHDQAEAMTIGDRIAVLREGRVEQLGTPGELYRTPATAFVATFVGSPPMSLLHATARPDGRPGAGPLLGPAGPADGVLLGVRPEDVQVGSGGEPLEVLDVEDLGHEVHVTLAVGEQHLVARVPPGTPVRRGDRVPTRVPAERVRVFDEVTGAAR